MRKTNKESLCEKKKKTIPGLAEAAGTEASLKYNIAIVVLCGRTAIVCLIQRVQRSLHALTDGPISCIVNKRLSRVNEWPATGKWPRGR